MEAWLLLKLGMHPGGMLLVSAAAINPHPPAASFRADSQAALSMVRPDRFCLLRA